MLDLDRFFSNPFNHRRLTLLRLIDFASTHLARMVANNPGALLDARIAATAAALAGLGGTMAGNEVKLALRKARVQAKEAFRTALPKQLARIHGALLAAFGPEATQVTACFPQGRSAFITCPDGELDEKLGALQSGLTPLAAQVGQGSVDIVAGLITTWNALLMEAGMASASKISVEAARRAARVALQLELFRNVLALAASFPDRKDMAAVYCPKHLLEGPAPARSAGKAKAA
jgi:hypothetical protein